MTSILDGDSIYSMYLIASFVVRQGIFMMAIASIIVIIALINTMRDGFTMEKSVTKLVVIGVVLAIFSLLGVFVTKTTAEDEDIYKLAQENNVQTIYNENIDEDAYVSVFGNDVLVISTNPDKKEVNSANYSEKSESSDSADNTDGFFSRLFGSKDKSSSDSGFHSLLD